MEENTERAKQPKTVELTIAGLQKDLKDGLTRKQQAKKYGVPLASITRAYKGNEALKGKRVFSPRGSNAVNIVLTDAAEFEGKGAKTVEGEVEGGNGNTVTNTDTSSTQTQTDVGGIPAKQGW